MYNNASSRSPQAQARPIKVKSKLRTAVMHTALPVSLPVSAYHVVPRYPILRLIPIDGFLMANGFNLPIAKLLFALSSHIPLFAKQNSPDLQHTVVSISIGISADIRKPPPHTTAGITSLIIDASLSSILAASIPLAKFGNEDSAHSTYLPFPAVPKPHNYSSDPDGNQPELHPSRCPVSRQICTTQFTTLLFWAQSDRALTVISPASLEINVTQRTKRTPLDFLCFLCFLCFRERCVVTLIFHLMPTWYSRCHLHQSAIVLLEAIHPLVRCPLICNHRITALLDDRCGHSHQEISMEAL